MNAIVVNEPGPPEVLRIEEVERPRPGPGEVLIGGFVAGVNYADVGMRAGMMGGPHAMDLPYTPGFEIAGTVAGVGEGVEGVSAGDRVAAVLPSGGYAEYAVAAAESVVSIPDGVGFEDASAPSSPKRLSGAPTRATRSRPHRTTVPTTGSSPRTGVTSTDATRRRSGNTPNRSFRASRR